MHRTAHLVGEPRGYRPPCPSELSPPSRSSITPARPSAALPYVTSSRPHSPITSSISPAAPPPARARGDGAEESASTLFSSVAGSGGEHRSRNGTARGKHPSGRKGALELLGRCHPRPSRQSRRTRRARAGRCAVACPRAFRVPPQRHPRHPPPLVEPPAQARAPGRDRRCTR